MAVPTGFNESDYLARNQDVADAVAKGQFSSGADHYNRYGSDEGRSYAPMNTAPSTSTTTTRAAQGTTPVFSEGGEERARLVSGTVTSNLTDPTLPPGTTQTAVLLDRTEPGQTLSGTGAMTPERAPLTAAQGTATGDTRASSVDATGMEATLVNEAAQATVAGQVDAAQAQAATASTQGIQSSAALGTAATASREGTQAAAARARAAQMTLSPEALTEAATGTAVTQELDVDSLVSSQIEQLTAGMETGNLPAWAKPAMASVDRMLAQRGLTRSSIGQDQLMNALIQSAIPIAQSNAQALQQRSSQNLSNLQQMNIANLSNEQQTRLANAAAVLQVDTANLDARQQTVIANLNAQQQANIANAQANLQLNIADMNAEQQMSLANMSNLQQTSLANASNRLQISVADLSAEQQTRLANAQLSQDASKANLVARSEVTLANLNARQQTLLSDQAASNAAKQFNAANETQTQQFMASLTAQVDSQNAARRDAMSQYNAGQTNAIGQFNSQLTAARDQFNATNALAIEQSNVNWRRQMNTIDTAAINSVNQANAMNMFNLSNQAQTFMWQEMRDAAKWSYEASENDKQRAASLSVAALGNDAAGDTAKAGSLIELAKYFLGP